MEKFIVAQKDGKELGYLSDTDIDMEVGGSNDFEIKTDAGTWNGKLGFGKIVFLNNTEYGGIIEDVTSSTATGEIIATGETWRGLMAKKIIAPAQNSSHVSVSGELNKIIRDLLAGRFGDLFTVPEKSTGKIISYTFDRYCTILSGLEKMLSSVGFRMDIRTKRNSEQRKMEVEVQAVKCKKVEREYNQDNRINFTTRDYRRGINHLICAGSGEGADRAILHLYVQKDGSIGEQKFYSGLEEKEQLYSYTNQNDLEELKKDGIKKLSEICNYKEFKMHVEDIDLEIGDIVAGSDYGTGTRVEKPIVSKIAKITDGKFDVEYKLKGEE